MINRRSVVLGLSNIFCLYGWSAASDTCLNWLPDEDMSKERDFNLSISRKYPFSFSKQPNNFGWCWAACIENMLKYHGAVGITQDEIVSRTYGSPVNRGGNPSEGISGAWVDKEGNKFEIETEFVWGADVQQLATKADKEGVDSFDTIANAMCANSPLILVYKTSQTSSHAVIIVGVSGFRKNGRINFNKIEVHNPWGLFETLSEDNYKKIIYAFKILM